MHTFPRLLLAGLFSSALQGALPSWDKEPGRWFAAVRSGDLQRVDRCLQAYRAHHPDRPLAPLLNSVDPNWRCNAFYIACVRGDARLAHKLFALGADPMTPNQWGYLPPYGGKSKLPREDGEEIYTQAQARMSHALAHSVDCILSTWLREAPPGQGERAWEVHITRHCLLPKLRYRDTCLSWAPKPSIANGFYAAIEGGRCAQVWALITWGIDVNLKDNLGFSALHKSSRQGHVEMTQVLIAHGASLDRQDNTGTTPLLWAAEYGHTQIAGLLLAHGADPHIADHNGRTPLLWATKRGHTQIVGLLLAHRADPHIADHHGGTPLSVAQQHKHQELMALLEQA